MEAQAADGPRCGERDQGGVRQPHIPVASQQGCNWVTAPTLPVRNGSVILDLANSTRLATSTAPR